MLTIYELKREVGHLNSKIDGIIKYTCMLNSGAENLDTILGMGKLSKDIKELDILENH